MIQNVPGGAIFDTASGSAASRSADAQQRQTAQASGASDKTSTAHDAATRAQDAKPVTQNGGAERTTDDAPRGRAIDIEV